MSKRLDAYERLELPPAAVHAFTFFVSYISTDRLQHLLRAMLTEYIANKHDQLPLRFHQSFEDLRHLFDLLDKIHDLEQQKFNKRNK
jgi:hypothetical protein